MDIQELKDNFERLSKQAQEATRADPALSALLFAILGFVNLLMGLFEEQKNLNERLIQQLGNKTLSNKRITDENINGKRSEKKKGIDSSDKNREKNLSSKTSKPQKSIKVELRKSFIGYKGKELSAEDAEKLIGTTFTGDDGKRYRYTRKLTSSVKQEIDMQLIQTQYYKLEYVEVDTEGNEVADETRQTAVSVKTDFLKKTPISCNLMAYMLYLWIGLKSPLNRVATSLSEYGIKISRQQLYKNVGITAYMLEPVIEHLKANLRYEKQICIDETYHQCREKLKDKEKSPPDKGKRKSQKSLSKSMRSYFYGIVGERVCIYVHDADRDYDIPKNILIDNEVGTDTFVETDGFYRMAFNRSENDELLFQHGLCWIHAKRYFCVLLNYAAHEDGTPIKCFIDNHWEQDIKDSNSICEKISNAFHVLNDITARCNADSRVNLVELKNKELKPLIEEICNEAKCIYADIKAEKNKEPKRNCSDKFKAGIVYIVNNEEKLKTFLDSPYGLMHSTKVEEKFRELDILRNSMLASDTFEGAEHLALFYSLYKTAQLNHIEFETYLRKVISVMTEHMSQIEFDKDSRGTITGYKSHSIPSEILDKLMPWNMA